MFDSFGLNPASDLRCNFFFLMSLQQKTVTDVKDYPKGLVLTNVGLDVKNPRAEEESEDRKALERVQ